MCHQSFCVIFRSFLALWFWGIYMRIVFFLFLVPRLVMSNSMCREEGSYYFWTKYIEHFSKKVWSNIGKTIINLLDELLKTIMWIPYIIKFGELKKKNLTLLILKGSKFFFRKLYVNIPVRTSVFEVVVCFSVINDDKTKFANI